MIPLEKLTYESNKDLMRMVKQENAEQRKKSCSDPDIPYVAPSQERNLKLYLKKLLEYGFQEQ